MESKKIRITGGNIRNGHIYLNSILDMFPKKAIGGSNKKDTATQLLTILYNGVGTIQSDIDGNKKIFRNRAAVKKFFKVKSIKENDEIIINKISKYEYEVKKA